MSASVDKPAGEMLRQILKSIMPTLNHNSHKGQCGRIGIVGGCKEYTGAPYFAAISALKLGCDLSHVFCTKDAAPVIKSYSPELIVHPLLDSLNHIAEIESWLDKMHSLVIGPGLGREPDILNSAKEIIHKAKAKNMPLVIDADGLFLITEHPELVRSYTQTILTPNVMEFSRLYKKLLNRDFDPDDSMTIVPEVAKQLGNVTVVLKGKSDIISNGSKVLLCETEGSARRCGGQGDLLSGSLGVFNFWSAKQLQDTQNSELGFAKQTPSYSPTMYASYAACHLTRICNNLAFQKYRRSTTTTDMIEEIHNALEQHFE